MKQMKSKLKEDVKLALEKAKEGDFQLISVFFSMCIPWEQIDWFFSNYMTRADKKRFEKFCCGQTAPLGGMYLWDLWQFFRGGKPLD